MGNIKELDSMKFCGIRWNLPIELCDITEGCMRMERKGWMKVNNINVKNISYLDNYIILRKCCKIPFPFPVLLKIKRSVEIFSGNLCLQDGYLSMEELCLVDCSPCSWDFNRYLEWWGLEVHPQPWAEMWALPMPWTSDCSGHPHQERGNCCAFQSVQWREQGSKAQETHTLDIHIMTN